MTSGGNRSNTFGYHRAYYMPFRPLTRKSRIIVESVIHPEGILYETRLLSYERSEKGSLLDLNPSLVGVLH